MKLVRLRRSRRPRLACLVGERLLRSVGSEHCTVRERCSRGVRFARSPSSASAPSIRSRGGSREPQHPPQFSTRDRAKRREGGEGEGEGGVKPHGRGVRRRGAVKPLVKHLPPPASCHSSIQRRRLRGAPGTAASRLATSATRMGWPAPRCSRLEAKPVPVRGRPPAPGGSVVVVPVVVVRRPRRGAQLLLDALLVVALPAPATTSAQQQRHHDAATATASCRGSRAATATA